DRRGAPDLQDEVVGGHPPDPEGRDRLISRFADATAGTLEHQWPAVAVSAMPLGVQGHLQRTLFAEINEGILRRRARGPTARHASTTQEMTMIKIGDKLPAAS